MESTEEKKVGIPESITINGVTYSVKDTPELQQFIQEVAKVEKSKLYTQFENMKAQIANLGKVKVVGDGSAFNMDELVEKLKGTFVSKDELTGALKETVKEVVQPVLNATEQSRQDELSQYREKLIQDNIATCIPDLVKGETKEELDASLQESIRIRAAYPTPSSVLGEGHKVVDPLIQKQQDELNAARTYTPTPAGGTEGAPTPPATPRRPSPEATGPRNVKEMPMSQFANEREKLEAELRAMYQ